MAAKGAQRAVKEYTELTTENPLDGYKISSDDPTSQWNVCFAGPVGSPFEGGVFHFHLVLDNYPFKPPSVVFKTKVYHPNVGEDGKICEQM